MTPSAADMARTRVQRAERAVIGAAEAWRKGRRSSRPYARQADALDDAIVSMFEARTNAKKAKAPL